MATRCCWLMIALCLNGVAAVDWSVDLPSSPICAVIGSTVVLPCSYDFPQTPSGLKEEEGLPAQGEGGKEAERYNVSSEMWCLEDSRCITPRYVFHSDGILQDPAYSKRVEYLGTPGTKNCSLKISDVRESDSGTYVFYIITNHPTQKMPEQSGVQLLVAGTSSAVVASASPPSGVTEGGALCLACCSPAAGSQAHYSWFKNMSPGPSHSGQVWNISQVTSDNSGTFYCQMHTGDRVQKSAPLSLDVEYSPRNTLLSATEEEPATLTCSSDANPPVQTYSWYEGAACLPSADKSFHPVRHSPATVRGPGGTNTAASITPVENGLHCCVARNRHGSQSYSLTVMSSRDTTTSDPSGHKLMLIGVTIAAVLAIAAITAFLMARRKKSSRHQSYVLTETTATEP
nr:sialoadhesin [Thamnaconus modestus]